MKGAAGWPEEGIVAGGLQSKVCKPNCHKEAKVAVTVGEQSELRRSLVTLNNRLCLRARRALEGYLSSNNSIVIFTYAAAQPVAAGCA